MNKLSTAERAAIVRALVEGNSIRATCRLTGAAKGTVTRLLLALGGVCDRYQDNAFRHLSSRRIECDEIWSFVHCKARQVKRAKKAPEGAGDAWTWTAIDPDSKLLVTWLVGKRDAAQAERFMRDLSGRFDRVIQLTTDGFVAYPAAVAATFRMNVGYAQLIKMYAQPTGMEARYSPPRIVGTKINVLVGMPDENRISTSMVERSNLTLRMSNRRLTRLTNGFSKRVENLNAAVALTFMHYNFARKHESLGGKTPAMAAGIADHRWTAEEIVALLDTPASQEPDEPKQERDSWANPWEPRWPRMDGEWLPDGQRRVAEAGPN